MSREEVRDLREAGAAGAQGVRRPLREGVSAEPEPDQDSAGEPDGRPVPWGFLIGSGVIAVLAAGAIAAAVAYQPPDPADCATLLQQAESTSDVGTLISEAGCVEPTTAHDPTVRP